jgi:NhaA family Na+:H+ antiporter
MVHVTKAVMEGGALYPLKKAITPIFGTIGGVIGPAAIYLAMVGITGKFSTENMGWAVCIATDISIAWLTAVGVFGTHPAIQFLLLLAVVDDVIGLIVIAVAFPTGDMHPEWLALLAASIAVSCILRWFLKVKHWIFYIGIAGPVSWYSLFRAGVHPALALCLVIPFIPDEENLNKFDHSCSLLVHLGLYFFALCNAGVQVNIIGLTTLNVFVSLILGKFLGIFCFTLIGIRLFGLSLPDGMRRRDLSLTSLICGAGLTVALFVAELAFKDEVLRGEAKLGALLSVIVAPVAIVIGKFAQIKQTFSN